MVSARNSRCLRFQFISGALVKCMPVKPEMNNDQETYGAVRRGSEAQRHKCAHGVRSLEDQQPDCCLLDEYPVMFWKQAGYRPWRQLKWEFPDITEISDRCFTDAHQANSFVNILFDKIPQPQVLLIAPVIAIFF